MSDNFPMANQFNTTPSKLRQTICALTLLWLCFAVSADANDVQDWPSQATAAYTSQNWQASIEAHQHWLQDEPENEGARYRLAQSHIHLKQGQAALAANDKLESANNIPPALVHYQRAQALALLQQDDDMWAALKAAALAGLRNINDLNNNPLWAGYRTAPGFVEIKTLVDQNINPCMHDDRYRQFDFWLGHWEVYGTPDKSGPLMGHNTISRTEQGCLIMEQWQGASGSTGTSMNYYDGIIDQWVQRWVSGGGTVIDYSGGIIVKDNKQSMQLVGKIYYASASQQPQVRDFRGTWTPLKGGVVQQFFEESTDGGNTWNAWFNGYYFPSTTSDETAP